MRENGKKLIRSFVVAAAAVLAGCNSTLDDEPDVVLEVGTLTIPTVTAALDSAGGGCVFTITNATATLNNKPKNQFAGSEPFNDIVLQNVTITSVWDNPAVTPVTTVFPVGGTVPANGSASVNFAVVNSIDLIAANDNPAGADGGHTAALSMVFRGTTVGGDPVTVQSGGALTVNTCQ